MVLLWVEHYFVTFSNIYIVKIENDIVTISKPLMGDL